MAMALSPKAINRTDAELMELFGVLYFEPGTVTEVTALEDDLYFYKSYVGPHAIDVEFGDCLFWVSADMNQAHLTRGPAKVESRHLGTVIRGFMPENKSSGIVTKTNLPYVNGCSTKQVFPPERLGDPTLQILDIPPYSSEQAHHIHSTARVVLVLRGSGFSVVGMDQAVVREPLRPGKVVILHKMAPHHFETEGEHLVVLPLHVWSSVPELEKRHPMFNGTFLT